MTEQMTGSILDMNFEDVFDFEVLPDSTEHQLRIAKAEVYKKEGGERSNLHIIFDVPDNPRVDDIHIYMGLPIPADDEKRVNKMKVRIKAFYEAVGVDTNAGPIDLNDLVGETLYVIIGEEDDNQYGKRNFVRQFLEAR